MMSKSVFYEARIAEFVIRVDYYREDFLIDFRGEFCACMRDLPGLGGERRWGMALPASTVCTHTAPLGFVVMRAERRAYTPLYTAASRGEAAAVIAALRAWEHTEPRSSRHALDIARGHRLFELSSSDSKLLEEVTK